MEIRPLTRAETVLAAAIHREARRSAMPWLPELHSPAEDRAHFREHVFESCTLLGAFAPECQGFLALAPGWVEHLYVAPARQGQGLGHALLTEAQAQQDALQLWCFARNRRALDFYRAHGFTEGERTDGRGNAENEPDIRLVWRRS